MQVKSPAKKVTSQKPKTKKGFKEILKIIGPGVVTGASDDDPSGIATYSQAGAQFGLATLWSALITFPLMASIQETCARIGMVTSQGLTSILKKNYSKKVLYTMLVFSAPGIVLNIGADIAGMGAVANLLIPSIPPAVFTVTFTGILMAMIIYLPYEKFAKILKYLCLFLLCYLVVPFFVKLNWGEVLKSTVIPTIKFNKDFVGILVAILGTTISPYLFFWQASMEVEDIKEQKRKIIVNHKVINKMTKDVSFGMFFSNVVMYFIILTTGAVLFKGGIHHINTVEQAAKALEPLAGKYAYALFSLGVIGTGFLAIPVLSGSLSFMFAETFGWKQGLNKKFHQARPFYIIIIISLILGLLLNYIGISPVQGLIYTAILYGVTSPILIAIIMHIANNKKIMKEFTNNKWSNFLGAITLLLMTAAAIALLYFQFK